MLTRLHADAYMLTRLHADDDAYMWLAGLVGLAGLTARLTGKDKGEVSPHMRAPDNELPGTLVTRHAACQDLCYAPGRVPSTLITHQVTVPGTLVTRQAGCQAPLLPARQGAN